MGSIIGPRGNQQLLSHIIAEKIFINYVYVDDSIWEESINIRRRAVDSSTGNWRTWDPFDSERL